MSFTHKWLVVTFIAQLLVSSLFLGVYFHRHTISLEAGVADTARQMDARLKLEMGKGVEERLEQAKNFARRLMTSREVDAIAVVQGGELKQLMGLPYLPQPERLASIRKEGSTNLVSVDDSHYLLTLSTVGNDIWVHAWIKTASVMAARDDIILLMVAFVLISAVSSSLFLAGYGNRLSSRLTALRQAALDLGAGKEAKPIGWRGKDELAVLASTFDNVSEKIRDHIAGITASASQLAFEKNRLDFILSSLHDGVIYMDAGTRILYCNAALTKMLSLKASIPDGQINLLELFRTVRLADPSTVDLNQRLMDELCYRKLVVELELDGGRVLSLRYIPMKETGDASHALVMVRDVSMQKNVRVLREEVERDPLTRLLNRRGFELMLEALKPQVVQGMTLGLIYVDLDGFKAINDNLGHKSGDQVLKSVSQLLVNSCRKHDVVARLGGDEFALIIHKSNWGLMENIANRILSSFEQNTMFKRILQNHQLTLSCSIGLAQATEESVDLTMLVERADRAMYLAKRRGKGQFCTEVEANNAKVDTALMAAAEADSNRCQFKDDPLLAKG